MGDHLIVDTGFVRDCASTVQSIGTALGQAPDLTSSYADAVGNSELAGALGDFANNWKHHRDRIVGDFQTFAKWADKAAQEYEDTDTQLKTGLTTKGSK